MRLALAFIFTAHGVYAQAVTAGAIGAIPTTDTFQTGFIHAAGLFPETVRFQVGPAIDFRLPGPFRVEIDALYQPFSFTLDLLGGGTENDYNSGSLWQFPAVLKYRIPTPLLKPFVEVGPSFQIATNITETRTVYGGPLPLTFVAHPDPNNKAVAGIVVGGGIDFRLGHFFISPQVRYTHWFVANFDFQPSEGVGSRFNQIQVLLSIRATPRRTASK